MEYFLPSEQPMRIFDSLSGNFFVTCVRAQAL